MTHTEISTSAEERRVALTNSSEEEAIISCMGSNYSAQKNSDLGMIISELNTSVGETQYFSEATIAKQSDPISIADQRIKNGMKMSGKKIDISVPPNWEKLKIESRNFRYKMHAWLMLDTLLSADEQSDCNDYLMMSVDIANDWIIRYVIQGEQDEFAWYDMATGQRATKLAYMIRRMISIGLSQDIVSRFIVSCEIHIIELTQEDRIAIHSNHGLFQMGGLIALCHSIPWLERSSIGHSFSIQILSKMIEQHFAPDGLHKEHSPEYHYFMVNHLSSFANLGWINQVPELQDIVNLVEDASWWMINPEKNVIAIGDSKNNLAAVERWDRASAELIEGMKVFPFGGLIIENTVSKGLTSQLVFSAQFHSRQHKHADDLNVLYHLNGRPFLVDPGTYTYQYDLPERIYCESTRGHNTVEIDGLNFSRFRQDAFGSALTLATKIGPCTVLRGKVRHKRLISPFLPNNKITKSDGVDTNVIHRRTLIHYPGRFLAVIDQLNSDVSHDYIQWNHFAPEYEIRSHQTNGYGVYNSKGKIECAVLSVDDQALPLNSRIIRGQTQPHLQGWISHNGRELIENSALGFSCSGIENAFVTIFDFKMQKTGTPYLRTGSKGKYLRFALTQKKSKVDIIFRNGPDGSLKIESIIDGKKYNDEFDAGVIS